MKTENDLYIGDSSGWRRNYLILCFRSWPQIARFNVIILKFAFMSSNKHFFLRKIACFIQTWVIQVKNLNCSLRIGSRYPTSKVLIHDFPIQPHLVVFRSPCSIRTYPKMVFIDSGIGIFNRDRFIVCVLCNTHVWWSIHDNSDNIQCIFIRPFEI